MFRNYYLNDDPFNKNNNRNLRNTPRRHFNCGGYALGTFSWYCPHSPEDELSIGLVGVMIIASTRRKKHGLKPCMRSVRWFWTSRADFV